MDRQEAGRKAKIMQAYADGKTIQYREKLNGSWYTKENISFNAESHYYRIKPKARTLYAICFNSGSIYYSTFDINALDRTWNNLVVKLDYYRTEFLENIS